MKRASTTPSNGEPEWNAFRCTIIQHLVDIEHWCRQQGRGMNTDGWTYELAERMQLLIVDERDYNRVHLWVAGLRPVAESMVNDTAANGGQHSLFSNAA